MAPESNPVLLTQTILDGLNILKIKQNSSFDIYKILDTSPLLETIEKILNLALLNSQQLSSIANALKELEYINRKHLEYALNIMTLEGFEHCNNDLWKYKRDPIFLKLLWSSDFLTGVLIFNKLYIVDFNYLFLQLIDLPLDEQLKKMDIYDSKINQYPSLMNWCIYYTANTGMLTLWAKSKLKLRLAITGIAIKRYYLKYKCLPKKLDELIPEFMSSISINPFTNKQLQYKQGIFELTGYKLLEIGDLCRDNSLFGNDNSQKTVYKKVMIKKNGCIVYGIATDRYSNKKKNEMKFFVGIGNE